MLGVLLVNPASGLVQTPGFGRFVVECRGSQPEQGEVFFGAKPETDMGQQLQQCLPGEQLWAGRFVPAPESGAEVDIERDMHTQSLCFPSRLDRGFGCGLC